jgi:WD40 repeat protein
VQGYSDVGLTPGEACCCPYAGDLCHLFTLVMSEPLTTAAQRMGVISGVSIHPDSSGFLSVGQDKRISFWDLAHANPVLVTNNPHGDFEPTCICVSNCGRFLATGGSDQRVCIWDATNSALLAEGVGHSGTITSVTFSPDSKQMISVGADGCILVWNIFTA